MMLLCLGLKCWIITNAMLVSDGILEKNNSSASRPPADEPIPTMGKMLLSLSTPTEFLAFARDGAFRGDLDFVDCFWGATFFVTFFLGFFLVGVSFFLAGIMTTSHKNFHSLCNNVHW
jgi:hypothetical protein